MAELYATIENPLVGVLAEMEHVGIAVDVDRAAALNARLTAEVRAARRRAAAWSSGATTSTSTRRSSCARSCSTPSGPLASRRQEDQDRRSRPTPRRWRSCATQWPEFIDPLLQYREVEKLRGTYGEGLLAEVAPDGRIHATFNQTVARTGRLSSDRRTCTTSRCAATRAGCSARRSSPPPGCELLVADYNQIELRCIAHLAADPGLIEAFTSGQDIHNATASRVFGVEPADVTLDQRSKAKMVVVRAGLRHGGVRPRSAPEHPDRGGGRHPRRLLRGLPEREGVHGPHRHRGAQARLHRDAVRPPPPDPRAARTPTSGSARRASARR